MEIFNIYVLVITEYKSCHYYLDMSHFLLQSSDVVFHLALESRKGKEQQ